MTSKEKAKKLVESHYEFIDSSYSGYYGAAKCSAIFTVDQIINALDDGYYNEDVIEKIEFWNEVKIEINKYEK